MKNDSVGEFEELVLLVVAGQAGDAYGVTIGETLTEQLNRKISISGVHVALCRLEDKGFVKSRFGGITDQRGGRRKKFYTVTALGQRVLDVQYAMRTTLYQKIIKPSFE